MSKQLSKPYEGYLQFGPAYILDPRVSLDAKLELLAAQADAQYDREELAFEIAVEDAHVEDGYGKLANPNWFDYWA